MDIKCFPVGMNVREGTADVGLNRISGHNKLSSQTDLGREDLVWDLSLILRFAGETRPAAQSHQRLSRNSSWSRQLVSEQKG